LQKPVIGKDEQVILNTSRTIPPGRPKQGEQGEIVKEYVLLYSAHGAAAFGYPCTCISRIERGGKLGNKKIDNLRFK